MKTNLPYILVAFAAGIAATLGAQALFFPGPDTPEEPPGQVAVAAEAGSSTKPDPIGKAPDTPDDNSILAAASEKKTTPATTVIKPNPKQRKEWQKKWQEKMRARTDEQNRVRLEYLAEELGLTPDQLEQVRAALEKSTEENLGAMSSGNLAAFAKSITGGDPLEAAVQDILTPEQEQAFTALKEKEQNHKIESRTMQRFANLPETLNLSETQKDQVYEIIAQEEAERLNSQSPASGVVSSVITTMTGDMLNSSVSIDLGEAVSAVVDSTAGGAADGSEPPQPQNIFAGMQERIQQRNEERVEQLKPVLNERQLEAYRSHLQQNQGLFGGAAGGVGGVQIQMSPKPSGSSAPANE